MTVLTIADIISGLKIERNAITKTCSEFRYKGDLVATAYQHDSATARTDLSLLAAAHCPHVEYVVISRRSEFSPINVEVFAHCNHMVAFTHAKKVRSTDSGADFVGVYRVKGAEGNKPILGALNIFASFDKQHSIQHLLGSKCNFKVI